MYTRANQYALSRYQTNIQIVPDLPYVGDQRPDDPIHWGAGPYAVLLAAKMTTDDIHLLGFDLYSVDKHVNNVYKGYSKLCQLHIRVQLILDTGSIK